MLLIVGRDVVCHVMRDGVIYDVVCAAMVRRKSVAMIHGMPCVVTATMIARVVNPVTTAVTEGVSKDAEQVYEGYSDSEDCSRDVDSGKPTHMNDSILGQGVKRVQVPRRPPLTRSAAPGTMVAISP